MNINGISYRSIWREGEAVIAIIDQTALPHDFRVLHVRSANEMVDAIKHMRVRGAPLIGVAAAYGIALAVIGDTSEAGITKAANDLLASRPTAVNLRWAVQRMLQKLLVLPSAERETAAWQEAELISNEDVELNHSIGQYGLSLLQELAGVKPQGEVLQVLTHCNAGWLATVDGGTALAPIYAAHDAGIPVHVWVDETRPRNQGASLTAWELGQHGIPHTVISDNAGGHLMQHKKVDCVIVGADRVTGSGDVCNKIGTYLKALAAHDNGIPFYAAVPSPTIDWTLEDGVQQIPIEERNAEEVAVIAGLDDTGQVRNIRILPSGSPAANPAFDVTPARLVTGIITERGIFSPSDLQSWHRE